MPRLIPAFPNTPESLQTVTLEGVQYRLRLTWRVRLGGWYLDLYQLDETPILLGQRLSPRGAPLLGYRLPAGPPGQFFVRGRDTGKRAALGTDIKLFYFESTEINATRPRIETSVTLNA